MTKEEIIKEQIKDHKKAIDKAQAELDKLTVTYSIGDRFKHKNGDKYILVALNGFGCEKVIISNLKNGHGTSYVIKHWSRITPSEFSDNFEKNFTRYWDSQKKIKT